MMRMRSRRILACLGSAVLASGLLLVSASPAGAVSDPGEVYGWGWNDRGELGDGTNTTGRCR